MEYKDDMRKLIDIVKQQSLSAPLQQTLDDMKMLTTAVKDLNDRIEIRVRKSLVKSDSTATAKPTKKVKKAKPFPSVSSPPPPTKPNIPTQTSDKMKVLQKADFNKMRDDLLAKQQSLQPTKPIPPT